jgi:hypothetical protein
VAPAAAGGEELADVERPRFLGRLRERGGRAEREAARDSKKKPDQRSAKTLMTPESFGI